MRRFLENITKNEFLFLAWLISIPFGAKVIQIPIGVATLYPSLILGAILLGLNFKRIINFSLIEKLIGSLLALLFFQSLIVYFWIPGKNEALFDIHSIILFNIYYFNFILIKYSIDEKSYLTTLNQSFKFFALIILLFGVLECFLGIHISGSYTYKLSQGLATVNYAPLFIYDNPNDYLVYSIAICFLFFVFNKELFQNKLYVFSILVLNLFFAHEAMSRFAVLFLMLMLVIFIWSVFLSKIKIKFWLYYIVPILVILLTNKMYLGPIINTQIEEVRSSNIPGKKTLNQKNNSLVIDSLANDEHKLDSYTVRKNLMINGIHLFKSNPIIGVGPGQFRYQLGTFTTKYPIDKNNSPHNYFIEMSSQFGILGILIFCIPLFLLLIKLVKKKWSLMFGILVFLYYLSGLMPSAFLYLDINWIVFSMIVICFSENFITFKPLKDVRFS